MSFLPGGSGERAESYINQGYGLSPLPHRNATTPNYSLNHPRSGSDSLTASTFPMWLRPRRSGPLRSYLLPLGDFHELSRAVRPNGQATRIKEPTLLCNHLTSAITSGGLPPLRRYSVMKVFTGLVTPSLALRASTESTL